MTTVKDKTPGSPERKVSANRTGHKKQSGIPTALIYEMDGGKPIYYRGYKEVLAGQKQAEEIMGSSKIQSYVISTLLKYLFRTLPDEDYEVLGSELGLQFEKKAWRACDIAIYSQSVLKDVIFDDKYASVPPKVVIEVDTKADLENFASLEQYYHQETEQLLQFGVERVIWIFTTQPRKIMIAEPSADWRITGWTSAIDIVPGVIFRLADLIKK